MNKNILLIDADSTIPNLALMKLSAFHKEQGDQVTLKKLNISYYPRKKRKSFIIDTSQYDYAYCSAIFNNNASLIKGEKIIFGGTSFSLSIKLDEKVESYLPDYSIYPENNTSYGFISRGCIRRCFFCKVPEKEGYIRQVSTIKDIVRHNKVKFLDNNFLALPNHKEILRELIDKKIYCEFNQGLDIRLIDRENSTLLSRLRYLTVYTFAFDNLVDMPVIKEKLNLLSWRKNWQVRFFIYTSPKFSPQDVVKRIQWVIVNKCFPYIMRDISCWRSEFKDFYTDLASWCNQPNLIKNMTFDMFLKKKHPKDRERINFSWDCYNGKRI